MIGYLSRQDGVRYLTCSGLPTLSCRKHFPENHIIKSLVTKLICSVKLFSYWPFLGLLTSASSQSINTQSKHGQYPAILTSRVVNNPYLFDKETPTSKHLVERTFSGRRFTDLPNVDSWVDAAADIHYNICAKNLFHKHLQKKQL